MLTNAVYLAGEVSIWSGQGVNREGMNNYIMLNDGIYKGWKSNKVPLPGQPNLPAHTLQTYTSLHVSQLDTT